MTAWNKNKSIGQKKPLTPKQVRHLKEVLGNKGLIRDLTLFSLGIDTMLRSGDLLSLLVEDVIDNKDNIKNEINLKQKKTGTSHIVMISEETKGYLSELIKSEKKYEDDYLFSGKKNTNKPLTTRMYRYLVKNWISYLGLNEKEYSTHSMRRTRAALIYRKTGNIEAVRLLLGQKSVTSTSSYLNLDKAEALDIGREWVI